MMACGSDERVLLKLITHEPCHIDELIRESGLPTTTVSSTLTMVELKGMIKQVGGKQYVLASQSKFLFHQYLGISYPVVVY
jgi:DNA processing protein